MEKPSVLSFVFLCLNVDVMCSSDAPCVFEIRRNTGIAVACKLSLKCWCSALKSKASIWSREA
eukprot:scaffold317_cov260-Pinguiococcus_pyrenoidosus.AAC.23